MPAETYTYFRYESANLRAAYGGDALLDAGDSAEIYPLTLTQRHIATQLGWPASGTHYVCRSGKISTAPEQTWARVSSGLYPSISPYLTNSELASVTTTAPANFTLTGDIPSFMPKVRKQTIFTIGDSISAGVSTTNDLLDAPVALAMGMLDSTAVEHPLEPQKRGFEGVQWAACNLALGGSSWGNTNAAGGDAAYPKRFDLAFNQRFRTLPLNTTEKVICQIWLGTNDLAYDTSLTPDQVWTRATTQIGRMRTAFPNLKIVMGTLIRRTENAALLARLNSYNTLLRANYASIGADYFVDYEAAHPDFSTTSGGNSASSNYAGDGVHPSTAGAGFLATALKNFMLGVAW